MSDAASAHGPEIDNLMIITMVLIFIVQTITQALLHYFAFKYRGRQGQKALYFADSNKLEFIWSIIPAIVLAVLILYGLYAWTNIMFVDEKDDKDAIVIELYAQQFKWEARYSGADDVLGKANVRYIEGVNNSFRARNRRFVRRTTCFSKKDKYHEAAFAILVRQRNEDEGCHTF